MRKYKTSIGLAFLAVFLAGLTAAGLVVARFGLSRINQAFDGLDSQTSVALAVSAIVAFICSAWIGRAIGSAKQREIDSRVHSERAAISFRAIPSVLLDAMGHPPNPTNPQSPDHT